MRSARSGIDATPPTAATRVASERLRGRGLRFVDAAHAAKADRRIGDTRCVVHLHRAKGVGRGVPGSAVLALANDQERGEDGPFVGVLKSPNWDPGVAMVSEPLLTSSSQAGVEVPLIVYGHDRGQSVSYLPQCDGQLTLNDARELAQAFYRSIYVRVERLHDHHVWLVTDNYYAPEKLLDADFAKSLHARLDAKMLIVGVPCRHIAAVAPADRDPLDATLKMEAFIRAAQQDAELNGHVCALPLLMCDGAFMGFGGACSKAL